MTLLTATNIKTGVGLSRNPIADAIDSGLPRFKKGYATLPATTDATDTTTIDVYAQFGITKVLIVREFVNADGTVKEETLATTAVTGSDLTVTVPAGSDNDARFIVVYGI